MLFRRRVTGVVDSDDDGDFVNGSTSENRRVGIGEAAERKKLFTLNLSIVLTVFSCSMENLIRFFLNEQRSSMQR